MAWQVYLSEELHREAHENPIKYQYDKIFIFFQLFAVHFQFIKYSAHFMIMVFIGHF